MADQIVEASPVTQSTPPSEPVLQNGNEGSVAPNMDKELNDALSKAFPNNASAGDQKSDVKPDAEPQKIKESSVKSDVKTEKIKAAPEGDLPTPDSIDQNPAKKQDGWNSLRNNYKRAHKLVAEREDEIKKLKAGLAEKGTMTAKEVETLKNEIKELSKYRTMIDIQADPEFISKYDQPLEKAQASVKEMLIGMNVSKEVVEQIDFNNTKLMDEITGYIEENRDKFQSKKFQRKVEEIIDLMDKRTETLSDHKKNYDEFMQARKKESSMKGAENEGRMIKHLDSIASARDKDGNAMFPFLSKISPKDGASQGEVDRANNHNHLVDVIQKKLNEAMKYELPEERAELAVAAVSAHYLKAQLMAAIEKINGLESEVSKISTVSTETDRSKPRNPAGKNGSAADVDLDTALASFKWR